MSASVKPAVCEIPIGNIKLPDAKRGVDDEKVGQIGGSISQVGLLNPLTVRSDTMELIAGRHRYHAVVELGWKKVPCALLNVDDDHASLARIDENLVRSELTAAERAQWIAERKAIYERLFPQTKQGATGRGGRKKKSDSDSFPAPAFVDDTSTKTGRSKTEVKTDAQIGKSLDPDEFEAIEGTPIANNKSDLLALAREKDKTKRQEAVEKVKRGEAKNAREALNGAPAAARPKKPPKGQAAPADDDARIANQAEGLLGEAVEEALAAWPCTRSPKPLIKILRAALKVCDRRMAALSEGGMGDE